MEQTADARGAGRMWWRVAIYLTVVTATAPLLRGEHRLSHGPELAAVTSRLLDLLGLSVANAGDVVSGSGFAMRVAPVCDGADLAVILGLAIMLSPAPWRLRALGVGVALVLTQLFNLGRLVTMFLVGVYLPQHFDLFHHVLWQAVAILFCVGIYAMWLTRTPALPS
jgi:exosortase/archaeosortase family protein